MNKNGKEIRGFDKQESFLAVSYQVCTNRDMDEAYPKVLSVDLRCDTESCNNAASKVIPWDQGSLLTH